MRHPGLSWRAAPAFSLIELVIVVVIIAIVAAIAIPRMSRGAAGAADAALVADLASLRSAVDRYAAEHGGTSLGGTGWEVAARLTGYTDALGGFDSSNPTVRTTQFCYGPYLQAIPPMPVGFYHGQTALVYTATVPGNTAAGSADGGWVYDTQTFWANAKPADVDAGGTPYANY